MRVQDAMRPFVAHPLEQARRLHQVGEQQGDRGRGHRLRSYSFGGAPGKRGRRGRRAQEEIGADTPFVGIVFPKRSTATARFARMPTFEEITLSAAALPERHQLLHHLPYLENAIIHVDPAHASGEDHHRIFHHAHHTPPAHSHA
jgi:hypothetical protein